MKYLIIGDLHGKKSSVDKVSKVLDMSAKIAKKADLTVFLGDLNDSKSIIRSEVMRLYIDKFKNWPSDILIVVGNHDYENSISCTDHSLKSLELLDNITICDKLINTDEYVAIPYLPEDRFLEVINTISLNDKLVFIHQDMDWVDYGNNAPIQSSIKSSNFEGARMVFSGHIHLPQDNGNICYVGTPYTESFKETDQEKSIVFYNGKCKRLSLPGIPKHMTFNYQIESLDDIRSIKRDLKSKIDDSVIARAIIKVPEEIEHKVKRSLFSDIKVKIKTEKIRSVDNKVKVTDSMSNIEIMERYIKSLDFDDDTVLQLIKMNRNILGDIK